MVMNRVVVVEKGARTGKPPVHGWTPNFFFAPQNGAQTDFVS
jgi:hypothetical protein